MLTIENEGISGRGVLVVTSGIFREMDGIEEGGADRPKRGGCPPNEPLVDGAFTRDI